MDATLKQIAPQTCGNGDLSESQLRSTISTAKNAISKVVADFEEARKAHAHDCFTDTPFVSSLTIVVGRDGLLVTMKFYRDHAEEYLSLWYMLIPVEQNGALVEKCAGNVEKQPGL